MTELLFVYNAKSNLAHKTIDFFHKIINPETYSCDLCKITHSAITERKRWKTFRENTKLKMTFLYRDEFEKICNQRFEYPVVLIKPNFDILLSKNEINKIAGVEDLITEIESKTSSLH